LRPRMSSKDHRFALGTIFVAGIITGIVFREAGAGSGKGCFPDLIFAGLRLLSFHFRLAQQLARRFRCKRREPRVVAGRDNLSWGKFVQAAVTQRSMDELA
jgi:hypothetical protein